MERIASKIERGLVNLLKVDLLKTLTKQVANLFYEETENDQIPKMEALLKSCTTKLSTSENEWSLNCNYYGTNKVTRIFPKNKFNPEKPTLIYHHGLGNFWDPADFGVVINDKTKERFNCFVIQASAHENFKRIKKECINKFKNLALTVAGSIWSIEEIVGFHNQRSKCKTVVCGFSLGGITASWHHFYLNTASIYFPISAYPNLGEILLREELKPFVANYKVLSKNKSYLECFEIPQNLRNKPKKNIFPILSKYDPLIDPNKAIKFWDDYEVTLLDSGHYSTVFMKNQITDLILRRSFS